jgi:hypothetical protein
MQQELEPARQGNRAPEVHSLDWPTYLVLCSSGLILALFWLGPSAASGLGTLNAMAFWAAHVLPAMVLLATTQKVLGSIPSVTAFPGAAQVLLSAVLASLLFTPFALAIDALFQAKGSFDGGAEPLWLRAISEFLHFVVPFVLVWLLINTPSLLQLEHLSAGPAPAATDGAPGQEKASANIEDLWSRVPGRLGRTLVALTAELHYLRVYTPLGNALILFPFGRAVKLLEAENGMQIHRSHWVSLDHVDEVLARGGRMICRMTAGPDLPVSRNYRPALKAARRQKASIPQQSERH